MLMPASSEFMTLCRSQVAILTQALGASLSIVYLTEEFVEGAEARLVPIVAYPETTQTFYESRLALPSTEINAINQAPQISAAPLPLESSAVLLPPLESEPDDFGGSEGSLLQQRQIILPLMHEGVVLGLLVTAREDRSWNEWERSQIDRIAETLTIACVLDQRYHWLEHDQRQQQDLRSRQTELMDNLLHQFRNPLTALKTFGKLLLKRLMPSDANRDVATSIVRETDRLQELLQQFERVVDLIDDVTPTRVLPPAKQPSEVAVPTGEARLEPLPIESSPIPLLPASGLAGDAVLELKPCWIAEIIAPLLASATAIAQERNLNLQTEIPANLPPVLANELALREVLSNLIDNALKYTPAQGHILVQVGMQRVTQQAKQQAVAISDTGLGIPSTDLEHVFERHYRGVQAQGNIPGTGLGLAIAQELIQQMQGDIQVFSPALVQPNASVENATQTPGTTFVIWLTVADRLNKHPDET
jgi:signal transduction histidine kinase